MAAELAGQSVVTDLGAVAAALLAIGAFLAGMLGLLRRVLRAEIQPIVEQFSNNGGSTLRDLADRLEAAQNGQTERLTSIDAALGRAADRMASLEDSVGRLDRKVDHHLSWHQVVVEQGGDAAGPSGALDERLDDDDSGQT